MIRRTVGVGCASIMGHSRYLHRGCSGLRRDPHSLEDQLTRIFLLVVVPTHHLDQVTTDDLRYAEIHNDARESLNRRPDGYAIDRPRLGGALAVAAAPVDVGARFAAPARPLRALLRGASTMA